jgi:hypothetical protein
VGYDRGLARLLRASVATIGPTPQQVARGLEPRDLTGLAQAAWHHGIPGYVRNAVQGLDVVPAMESERLDELRLKAVRRHLRTVADLLFISAVMETAGLPWAVIKGPALSEPLHGSPDLRWSNDLDVLVPPAHFGAAVVALEDAGCDVPRQEWEHLRRTLRGEIDVWLPSGSHLDLHWHLVIDRAVRERFTVNIEELFERRTELCVGPASVPTLGWPDMAVYVALHAVLSGTDRLVTLKDVQLLTGRPTPTLEELEFHARQWQADLAVRTVLRRTQRSIGLAPGVVLDAAPRGERAWDRVCRAAWQVSPAERHDGGASLGRLVARAVRSSQRDSFAALAENGLIVLRYGSQGVRTWPWQGRGATQPAVRQDDPDMWRQRDGYLAAVARQATVG